MFAENIMGLDFPTGISMNSSKEDGILTSFSLGYVTLRYVWSSSDAHFELHFIWSYSLFSGCLGFTSHSLDLQHSYFSLLDFLFVTGLHCVGFAFRIGWPVFALGHNSTIYVV